MKSPLDGGFEWRALDEVPSTQKVAGDLLRNGEPVGVVFAREQTQGRGRFGRPWVSREGDSLTYSLVFHAYADHPRPYLVGMAAAIAAAGVLHCQLRWPNDLVEGGKKLGGILTELLPDSQGRKVPVVGIGINLNQSEFPADLEEIATSASIVHGGTYDPEAVGHRIVSRLADLPEPTSWGALAPIWNLFDATPGKRFRLPSGEEGIALGIGSDGQLLCSVDGESQSVLAADAIFGS
ncbi:biotin--[acetyl-CoA-carboxylase] ligase [Fimbriimonas ginsengisoli]|uniref:Biotin operon repressor containing HTH and biotin-(Acetyl-CoA carboxylase) ligase n=1 Tax=Fimbriimonas ginsengisoli Gsoil 348 TaxID=661478 RepID=A0A068NU92_FIMGI|nr:biotin--[acetyl-CoA-carboxylase] ligase [Fimbriimonas ginsengisoli]AIE87006.1 biotin operon repressor containing HTH and biotin-(acetyl-CoA carboxylase) ligase [Fimbriimonas ginsengisoli Gsoil 348]